VEGIRFQLQKRNPNLSQFEINLECGEKVRVTRAMARFSKVFALDGSYAINHGLVLLQIEFLMKK
jgi:hypothetical protein